MRTPLILTVLVAVLVAGGTATYAAAAPPSMTAPAAAAATTLPQPTCVVDVRIDPLPRQMEVRIRNLGATPTNGWTLTWAMPDFQRVLAIWVAQLVSQTGGVVTVRDLGWNAAIPPGGTMTFGMVLSQIIFPPTSFALNGVPCGPA